MNAALWGAICALSWGGADFAARFSGRALGPRNGLFAMLLVGSAVLSAWHWWQPGEGPWEPSALWLLLVCGIATMIATLLLYAGLARGPVTVVAPIVGAYPVLVAAFWVAAGLRPAPIQWLAMAVTVAGVMIVARAGEARGDGETRGQDHGSVTIALLAAAGFAVVFVSGQAAVPIFGELRTLWASRLISLASLGLVFLLRRERPLMPWRWWPLLALQGLLDAGGYLAVFTGSHGEGQALVAVTASAFGAVTVLLARIFLRERMSLWQWLGIVMIFTGVGVLAGYA